MARLVFARGRQHRLPFDDVNADWFLHPHIEPGANGVDHRKRVPVIGRADEDGIEVTSLQQFPIVRVGTRLLLGYLSSRHQVGCIGEHSAIDITQRNDLNRCNLNHPQ